MKSKALSYISALALASVAVCSCGDDFVNPPMILPSAPDMEANTTIADLKARYWSSDRNYVATVGDYDQNGGHIIIKGRVV